MAEDGGKRKGLRLADGTDVAEPGLRALATEHGRDGRRMRVHLAAQAAVGWVACRVFGLHAYVSTHRSVEARNDLDSFVPEVVHGECIRCGDTFDFEN